MNSPNEHRVQPGAVIWITGRPSAGKSVFAERLKLALDQERPSVILDGDSVRQVLKPTPGYTASARQDFYATLVGLAELLASQGLLVLVPATAASSQVREQARARSPHFIEVYIDTPLEECERRDSKGLYQSARQGKLSDVPGVDVPYEPPTHPEVVAQGGRDEQGVAQVVELIRKLV